MPHYRYSAFDSRGSERSGVMEAFDQKQAAMLLRQQGLFPTAISAEQERGARRVDAPDGSSVTLRAALAGLLGGVSRRELAVFTRQLGTLLKAGMPLLRSLEVLGRQARNPRFRAALESAAESIRAGNMLSQAMAQRTRIFGRLYIAMIKAGEAGGALDVVLERLARFQEKSLQLRAKVRTAMVYPLIVLVVAAAILAGLLVFVVPRFQQVFSDLLKGAPLPPLTAGVLNMSEWVKERALVMAGLGILAWAGFGWFRRTTAGARLVGSLAVKLPLFGDLFLKAAVARFSRTLGTLLASGVPILQALTITRETCENAHVALAIGTVHDRVKAGSPMTRPLEATGVFPPMVISMVEVGEHSGQLPEMLGKLADIYEEEVDHAVAGLSALIEPVMILFLALVVGTVVIALFLPIMRIVQLLS